MIAWGSEVGKRMSFRVEEMYPRQRELSSGKEDIKDAKEKE